MIMSEAKQFDLLVQENVMSRVILICSMLLMNSVWANELPPFGYVSGVITKLKPEAVKVKTPTGTIGVRGIKFVVKVG